MAVMIEARSFRPFKSSEEYLYAMKEDLAEWLNILYPELMINVDNFMDRLDTGVALCKHANNVRASALEHNSRRAAKGLPSKGPAPPLVQYLPAARPATFFARDNVSNFISWCRKSLGIFECLLFETDDLIMRKNEKHVILCLLEVARKGSKFGMLAPMLVQMERQIDREILADARKAGGQSGCEEDEEDEDEGVGGGAPAPPMMYGPVPQIVTNDLKSLDEMVRDLVERCSCPTQFPMIRVSEGKYRIGDTKVLIFVRVLRSHVMVRVGGGWDTLSHYLDKHDPCRCRAQHRPTLGARVIQRYPPANNQQCIELTGAEVHYDRSRRSSVSSVGSSGGGSPQHTNHLGPPQHTAARQRSRSPAGQAERGFTSLPYMGSNAFENQAFNHLSADQVYKQNKYINRRSVSPSPARKSTNRTLSPNPQRKSSMQNYPQVSSTIFNNPALVPSTTLVPSPHRNGRSRSPTPKAQNRLPENTNNSQKTIKNAQEKNSAINVFENQVFEHINDLAAAIDTMVNGSENVSDNGSEVSDEGYRSLGIIQNNSAQSTPPNPPGANKDDNDRGLNLKLNRLSLNSQASADDAEISERTDLLTSESTLRRQQSSSDCSSQMSTTEDRIKGSDDSPSSVYNDRIFSERQNSPVVEVSSFTGLRKTNYSETLYGDKKPTTPTMERKHVRNVSSPVICLEVNDAPSHSLKNSSVSKIPQSPILQRRRLSMENLSPNNRSRSASRDRFLPRDRSGSREPSNKQTTPTGKNTKDSKPPVPTNSPTHSNGSYGKVSGIRTASAVSNTWNGRSPAVKGKLRPPVTNETFTFPAGNKSKIASPSFQRNTNGRSSTSALRSSSGYDHNGRRIKSPPNTSPAKTANKTYSPLLETILKTAENTQDDATILEKMKDIIKQYSGLLDSEKPSPPVVSEMDDFTTAWVHSNGTLERSQSSRQLRDSLNNCSVGYNGQDSPAYDPGETSSGFKSTALVSKIPMFSSTPRRDPKSIGLSRIPAPVSYKKPFFD